MFRNQKELLDSPGLAWARGKLAFLELFNSRVVRPILSELSGDAESNAAVYFYLTENFTGCFSEIPVFDLV